MLREVITFIVVCTVAAWIFNIDPDRVERVASRLVFEAERLAP